MSPDYLPTLPDLAALAAILVVLVALHCLGTPVAAGLGPAQHLLVGWAIAGLVLTMAGILGIPLTPVLVVAAIAALAVGWLWRDRLALRDVSAVLLVLLPLILVIAPRGASEVDDFAHWIPNAAYIYEHGHLPSDNDVPSPSFKAAYPLNSAFIMMAASQLAGRFLEASGTMLNTLLIGTLALLLIRQLRGRDRPIGLSMAAFGVLGATLLNPTFVPKIAITGYAEFTTGVVLAGFAALAVEMFRRAADATHPQAEITRAALAAGLVLSLLVNIKQTNVVLAALGLLSVGILAIAEPAAVRQRIARAAPLLIALPLFAYAVWRIYVSRAIPVGENKIRPLAEWNLHILDEIVGNMVNVLLHKGGLTALGITAIVAAALGLARRRRDDATRLAVIGALLFLGNTGFLGFIYVAHFNEDAGGAAQSFWRYSTQLGPVLLLCATALLGRWLERRPVAVPRWAAAVLLVLAVAAPVAMAGKLRFDLDPPLPYIEEMASDIEQMLPDDAKLLIVVLKDDGLQATVMRLRNWQPTRDYHVLDNDRFQPEVVRSPSRPNYAWFYCASDRLRASFGLDLPRDAASLAVYEHGAWHIARTWAYPLPPGAPTGHRKFQSYGCTF